MIITQRDLVRNWARLKTRLQNGEIYKLIVPENGHRYVISIQLKNSPGDIRELLKVLKKMPLMTQKKHVRVEWDMKYQKLMAQLARTHNRKKI